MGNETDDQTIEHIKVTIGVASNSDALSGSVDLDCGFKLPLRLTSRNTGYVKSDNEQEAVLPSRTSIAPDSTLEAGRTAWFEFDDSVGDGFVSLGSLRASGIRRIRFITAADSAWAMEGYTIEINGRLFAANHALNSAATEKQHANRIRFTELTKRQSELSETIASLQALIAAGSADEYKPELNKLQEEAAVVSRELEVLRPALAAPFFVETQFRPVAPSMATGAREANANTSPGSGVSADSQGSTP